MGMELVNVHFFEEAERVFVGVGVIHKIRIPQLGGKDYSASTINFVPLARCSRPLTAEDISVREQVQCPPDEMFAAKYPPVGNNTPIL